MLIKKSVTSARIERCRTTMNGTDDPRPLTERIRQIAVGLPLGKCHRQEAMCNHEGCRLKNLEALVAEVGELERDIHRNKAYVAEHVRCFLERAEAAEAHVRNHHLEACETCAATESERNVAEALLREAHAMPEVDEWDGDAAAWLIREYGLW